MQIHKPGKKISNKPIGNPKNPLSVKIVSPKEIETTEMWDCNLNQPWEFGNVYPYRLVMNWVIGQNFAITKIFDGSDMLIYYYSDICSPVIKNGYVFEFEDWYLDIIKYRGKEPYVEDEDEFNQAV